MSRYVETFKRYRWRLVALTLVLPLVASAAAIELLGTVTARTSLWVDSPTFYDSGTTAVGWNVYETPAQNVADGMRQLIQTNSFTVQVADQVEAGGGFRSAAERSQLIANAKTDIQVVAGGAHLVQLTYTCQRPKLCTQVLDATLKTYMATPTKQYRGQATAAVEFYTSQLEHAQATLLADQDAMAAFMNRNPGLKPADVAVDPRAAALSRQVVADQGNVASIQTKLDNAQLSGAAASTIFAAVVHVVDPPAVAGGGVLGSLPRKPLLIIWAACLGAGATAIWILARIDRTVRDPRDLERHLGLPVVAEVPMARELWSA
jgi:uncharacterized protein involved in exopolysaccharide biosynthesis